MLSSEVSILLTSFTLSSWDEFKEFKNSVPTEATIYWLKGLEPERRVPNPTAALKSTSSDFVIAPEFKN